MVVCSSALVGAVACSCIKHWLIARCSSNFCQYLNKLTFRRMHHRKRHHSTVLQRHTCSLLPNLEVSRNPNTGASIIGLSLASGLAGNANGETHSPCVVMKADRRRVDSMLRSQTDALGAFIVHLASRKPACGVSGKYQSAVRFRSSYIHASVTKNYDIIAMNVTKVVLVAMIKRLREMSDQGLSILGQSDEQRLRSKCAKLRACKSPAIFNPTFAEAVQIKLKTAN